MQWKTNQLEYLTKLSLNTCFQPRQSQNIFQQNFYFTSHIVQLFYRWFPLPIAIRTPLELDLLSVRGPSVYKGTANRRFANFAPIWIFSFSSLRYYRYRCATAFSYRDPKNISTYPTFTRADLLSITIACWLFSTRTTWIKWSAASWSTYREYVFFVKFDIVFWKHLFLQRPQRFVRGLVLLDELADRRSFVQRVAYVHSDLRRIGGRSNSRLEPLFVGQKAQYEKSLGTFARNCSRYRDRSNECKIRTRLKDFLEWSFFYEGIFFDLGTKWCGRGDIAITYRDLGESRNLDRYAWS